MASIIDGNRAEYERELLKFQRGLDEKDAEIARLRALLEKQG